MITCYFFYATPMQRRANSLGLWFDKIDDETAIDWINRILAPGGPQTLSQAIRLVDPQGLIPRDRIYRMFLYLGIRFEPPKAVRRYNKDEDEYIVLSTKKIIKQSPMAVYFWFCDECDARAEHVEEARAFLAANMPPIFVKRHFAELSGMCYIKAMELKIPAVGLPSIANLPDPFARATPQQA
ncbi:MAG: hypothetical protein P4L69_05070 [Desulfosporosinus sp.]|nr:hypothetical protein [Desulfosporosinus sp.]